jgi:hypothetical protein
MIFAACVLALPAGRLHAAAPTVASVYPARQRIDAGRNTIIEVHFSAEIAAASVTPQSFRVFGRWSGPATGSFAVSASTVTFTPDDPFFAGEWVTVNLSRDIQSTTGESMVKGHAWNFWIETAHGSLTLSYDGRITCRRTGESWVQVYGAYAGDLDDDGWSDITAPCEQSDDARVFLNDSGVFSTTGMVVETLVDGNIPSPNEPGDFDNDGHIDLVVGNTGNNKASILFGDGAGDFPTARKISHTCGSTIRGVGVGDFNGDGWDDFVTANRVGDNLSVVLNNGDGTFAPSVVQNTGGNGEYAVAIADANNDGIPDIFCGTFDTPYYMIVLLGNGNGGFAPQTPVAQGGRPWQTVVGDFNLDGNVDVASCNSNTNNIGILFGNGLGAFTGAVTLVSCDAFPLAIDAGDLDGDGDLELVTSNYTGKNWNIFQNTGGVFGNKKVLAASSAGSCATLHDRDNDGDLDLTGLDEEDDWIYFYENTGPASAVRDPSAGAVSMLENDPNPFNPSTSIRFELRRDASLDLAVYDATGARVVTLRRGPHAHGSYSVRWNGTGANGERVGSGVYFCRLVAGGESLTRKMVLLK